MIPVKGRAFAAMNEDRAAEILEGALRLLEQVGLAVPPSPMNLAGKLEQVGFSLRNGRLRISRQQATAYLERLRAREAKQQPVAPDGPLTGMVSIYANRVERLDGAVYPFTARELEQWAAFCHRCGQRYGFADNVPGYASDIPGELESLHKYWVSARYCTEAPLEPSSSLSAQYMLEMAEVLGVEERRYPAFPASPLSFSGGSLESVVACAPQLDSAYVYAMSMLGVTTPMAVSEGFAVNLAEVLGCAVALHHLTGLEVDIRPNLIPFDFRACVASFGSPEKFQLEWMAAQLYAHLMERPVAYASTNIHTYAQHSGAQAAFEKGWMMAAGMMLGARRFYCIGTIAMDEVFSPVQLVWDAEMMRQLETLRQGLPLEAPSDDFLDTVEEGLAEGFMGMEQTLENYPMIAPGFIFSREGLAAWQAGVQKDALEKAREVAHQLAEEPAEELLAPDKAAELEAIYLRATRANEKGEAK